MKKKLALLLSFMLLLSSVGAFATEYKVKEGDVLWKIAAKYGMDYHRISDYNKLADPNLIYVDQILQIPEKDQVVAKPETVKPEAVKNNVVDLTLLATSDLHGRIYPYNYAYDKEDKDAGVAKISTLVKAERAKDPELLLVDCGDTVQDNSAILFNADDVHPMVKALNAIGTDVWAIGNHEFNYDREFIDKNIKAFKGEVLSTNIYKKGTDERYVKGYHVFDVKGIKVAVIGLVPPHVPYWEASHVEKDYSDLEFRMVISELGKAIKELDGQYDVLVGAFHLGPDGEYDYKGVEAVAKTYPEFDLIFAGHAHSRYKEEINGVQIIEPGCYGWALAKAEVKVEKDGENTKVLSVTTENSETKEIAADQEILDMFKYVHDKSLADANQVVGEVTADYIEKVDYITGEDKVTTMPTSQIIDTALIDLINEVQLYYTGADVSSAAAFRRDMNLEKGDFKKKDAVKIYKYPNTLMGVNITGAKLKEYMEWSASYYNTLKEGDVTVSFNPEIRGYNYDMFAGVDYKIDVTKEAGHRIVDATIKGQPIEDDKIYKLAVNNYRVGTLVNEGFIPDADSVKYYDSYEEMQDDGRIRDLIPAYIKEKFDGKFTPRVDNNWELIGLPKTTDDRVAEIYELIKAGKIVVPVSEDGRTPNIKSVNINELIKEGIIPAKAPKK